MSGGIPIGDEDGICIAPSACTKGAHETRSTFFCTDMAGSKFEKTSDDKLKLSECTPLFTNAHNLREAGTVMHRISFHEGFLSTNFGLK